MTFFGELVERVDQSGAQPFVPVFLETHFLGDRISGPETDPPDIVSQTERILSHDLNTVRTVLFVDFGSMRRAHVVILQKEHDVFDFFLLFPAVDQCGHPGFPESGNFGQPLGFFLDDPDRIGAEHSHDALRKFRSDPLDQAGTEIFLDAVYRGWQRFFVLGDHELPAVFGLVFPLAFQIQDRSYEHFGQITDASNRLRKILDPAFDDGIAVFGVLVCDSIHDRTQLFQKISPSTIFKSQAIVANISMLTP